MNSPTTDRTDRVLILSADPAVRAQLAASDLVQHDVHFAESGPHALEHCRNDEPDVLILDVHAGHDEDFALCHALRAATDIPIICLTELHAPADQLRVFDAGGSDIVVKPIQPDLLQRKIDLAIQNRRAVRLARSERDNVEKMAMGFLSSLGSSGVLLRHTQSCLASRSHADLAKKLIDACGELGVRAKVLIRHDGGPTVITASGAPTPLERSVLGHIGVVGHAFQFHSRYAVNYDRVSLIVDDLPADPETAGRARDNLVILAEVTNSLCEIVDARIESMARAETLQDTLSLAWRSIDTIQARHRAMLYDVNIRLHGIVHDVESTYSWLGINQEQEQAISQTLQRAVDGILLVLNESGNYDQAFRQLIDTLHGKTQGNEVELF